MHQTELEKGWLTQVTKEHYDFEKYLSLERFSSYWYQLREILVRKPKSVLEIGPGDFVVANYIKHHTDIKYTSVDFAKDLKPDIVADIRKLPQDDNSYDLVCAFEVLEHIPFEDFSVGLKELLRVSKNYVLISLPHWGRSFAFMIQLPFFGKHKFNFKLPYSLFKILHRWDGEHYWEIGKENYPIERIRESIWSSGGKLETDFVPTENVYHHFFVIKK